ncbi:MAG TPA: JAB domain-containing protein [Ottowia sp.]|uniref:JAB domain-containing protein n=1 Tax=Ottowia sp. TaxID=1898956 RepID=UPI002C637A43|nr:JAB domain-containing protein [Ottowia sp.]HMN20582.1 JAB domain-containing protein [Ottowia sp.]
MTKPHTRPPVLSTYGVADGACSLRYSLSKTERATLDRSLRIVGRVLVDGRSALDSPGVVRQYLALQLRGEPVEHFSMLLLDSQHRCIVFECLVTGTINQASIYPRQVVRAAPRHGAAAVVLVQNHPSGDTTPSRADEALTQSLKAALRTIDVRVLDHMIVAGGRALSMAGRGML